MLELIALAKSMAWPVTILIAWFAGEAGARFLKLPRISVYALTGFVAAHSQLGLLPASNQNGSLLLANVAFGLILFEAGHRFNLRWLACNYWLGLSSLCEAFLSFVAVYWLALQFQVTGANALLLAALAMASSPATVVQVVNEQKSAGQVSERALHLSVLNCVLVVFAFKLLLGLVVFKTSGSLLQAAGASLLVLASSAALGALFGTLVPLLLRAIHPGRANNTLAFALAVIVLVALTHALKLSPVLATLTFGLTVRHRRIVLSQSERGFGVLGDLLSVILFVYATATLAWQQVLAGVELGMLVLLVRTLSKMLGVSLFAWVSGISWRKGWLTGMAMLPISAFVVVLLEQSRYLGIDPQPLLAPLAAALLTLEIFGPVLARLALVWAHEVPDNKEECHVT